MGFGKNAEGSAFARSGAWGALVLSVAGVHFLIDSACGLEVLELGLWGFWGPKLWSWGAWPSSTKWGLSATLRIFEKV